MVQRTRVQLLLTMMTLNSEGEETLKHFALMKIMRFT